MWAEQGDELTDGRYAGLRNTTETARAGLTLFIFTGLFLPNMLAIDFYRKGLLLQFLKTALLLNVTHNLHTDPRTITLGFVQKTNLMKCMFAQ